MFRKLFGETEQDQIQFLHPRAIATLVILALMVVALILHAVGLSGGADAIAGIAEMGVAIVLLFVWGWPVVKGLLDMSPAGRQVHFKAMRKLAAEHPSEKVGEEIRKLYSWNGEDKLINN